MKPAWALTSGSRMQNPSLGKWDIMVSVVNWMIMQEKWDLLLSQNHLAMREQGTWKQIPGFKTHSQVKSAGQAWLASFCKSQI